MKKPSKVREPVQVYLATEESRRIRRLAQQLDATKSDVLRRGLAALEEQLGSLHPLLELSRNAPIDNGPPVDYDVVLEHDRAIAEYVERQIEERWAEIEAARKRRHKRRG